MCLPARAGSILWHVGSASAVRSQVCAPSTWCVFLRLLCVGTRVTRLTFLGCARIAADVKKLGVAKLKEIYSDSPALTTAEERDLKSQNEWAWKEAEKPVENDDDDDAAATAGAGDAAAEESKA